MLVSIVQQSESIFNMYASNYRIYEAKLLEFQGEIDESTIIVADFNIPASEVERSSRQKITKDIAELNSTNH